MFAPEVLERARKVQSLIREAMEAAIVTALTARMADPPPTVEQLAEALNTIHKVVTADVFDLTFIHEKNNGSKVREVPKPSMN